MVDTTPPSTPTLAFSGLSSNTYYNVSTNTLYFRPASGGAFAVTASASDADTGILRYSFSSLAANGFTGTQSGGQNVYAFGTTATQPAAAPTVSATNNAGAGSANASYGLAADASAPTGGALSVNATAASAAGSSSFNTTGSFAIGTRTEYGADSGSGLASSVLTRATGTLSANSCSNYGAPATIAGNPSQSGLAEGCYLYTLTGTDRVGNAASISTTVKVDKTAPAAKVSVPANANGSVAVTFSATDAGSGVNAAKGQLKRAVAAYTASTNTCGTFGAFASIGPAGPTSPYTDTTVATGNCYEYEYTVPDLAGNSATSAASTVRVNTAKPTLTSIADTTPGHHRRPAAGGRRDHAHLQRSDRLLEHPERPRDPLHPHRHGGDAHRPRRPERQQQLVGGRYREHPALQQDRGHRGVGDRERRRQRRIGQAHRDENRRHERQSDGRRAGRGDGCPQLRDQGRVWQHREHQLVHQRQHQALLSGRAALARFLRHYTEAMLVRAGSRWTSDIDSFSRTPSMRSGWKPRIMSFRAR